MTPFSPGQALTDLAFELRGILEPSGSRQAIVAVYNAVDIPLIGRVDDQGLLDVPAGFDRGGELFQVLAGGFLGLEWPAAPAWESEIFKFIGDCLTFAAGVIAVVGGAWTSLSGLYEGVLKRIFETFGFGTETAVAARRATGFWG